MKRRESGCLACDGFFAAWPLRSPCAAGHTVGLPTSATIITIAVLAAGPDCFLRATPAGACTRRRISMALVTMRQLLDEAAKGGYGVGAFNVNDMEQIQAIMAAAEETK